MSITSAIRLSLSALHLRFEDRFHAFRIQYGLRVRKLALPEMFRTSIHNQDLSCHVVGSFTEKEDSGIDHIADASNSL
jgi:hypothetical protein